MTRPAGDGEEQSLRGEELRRRYLAGGNADDLAEATRLGRLALAQANSAVSQGVRAFRLGTTLSVHYEVTADAAILDEAARLLDTATKLLPAGHADLHIAWTNAGAAMLRRSGRTAEPADLDTAIAQLRKGARMCPPDDSRLASTHNNLAGALRFRYQIAAQPDDLDEAIRLGSAAVRAATDEHRAMMMASLAGSLRLRFDRATDIRDLNAAMSYAEDAIHAAPPGSSARASALVILADCLRHHYEVTGSIDSLTKCVNSLRETSGMLPDAHPEAAIHHLGLSESLRIRFEHLGVAHDLDQAIAVGYRACALARIDALRWQATGSLAMLLRLRAARNEASGDTQAAVAASDEALRLARRAVALTPRSHHDRPDALTVQGNMQMARYQLSREAADVSDAIVSYQAALMACLPGDPRRTRITANLGQAQVLVAAAAPAGDLEQAIALLRKAVAATEPGTLAWSQVAANLAGALARRWSRRRADTDRAEVLQICRQATDVPGIPPDKLALLSMLGAELEMTAEDPAGAAPFYQAAVEQLPAMAWLGLDWPAQQSRLEPASELARNAAACLLATADNAGALQRLEQGRGVLWTQLLQLRERDAELEWAHPQLAARLQELAAALRFGPDQAAVMPPEGTIAP